MHCAHSVTLGNIVGGTLLVAAIYWFMYLRNSNGDHPESKGSVRRKRRPGE